MHRKDAGPIRSDVKTETVSPAQVGWRQQVLDRRRFLAMSSGCLLGTLCCRTGHAAEKSSAVDLGALKDFAEDGISEAFAEHGFLVIRDQGQLFAVSTTCPHRGNTLHKDPQDSAQIVCEGHGSTFNTEGKVTVGPASDSLTRLGISVNSAGHVMVQPDEEFPEVTWTDKRCFIAVK